VIGRMLRHYATMGNVRHPDAVISILLVQKIRQVR
jgi:hypothetical protein